MIYELNGVVELLNIDMATSCRVMVTQICCFNIFDFEYFYVFILRINELFEDESIMSERKKYHTI